MLHPDAVAAEVAARYERLAVTRTRAHRPHRARRLGRARLWRVRLLPARLLGRRRRPALPTEAPRPLTPSEVDARFRDLCGRLAEESRDDAQEAARR